MEVCPDPRSFHYLSIRGGTSRSVIYWRSIAGVLSENCSAFKCL